MTRKKVELAFITNNPARKASYKKRIRGVLKKFDELTTLCDVQACAILYSPYDAQPVVWPNPSAATELIAGFKQLPEMEKVKTMMTQEEFFRNRVEKANDQLKWQQRENREKQMTHVMYQCLSGKHIQDLNLLDLSDLGWVIKQHLDEINKRINALKKENCTPKNINDDMSCNKNNANSVDSHTTSVNNHTTWGPPPSQQAITPKTVSDGWDLDAMRMMMQPWSSSYVDMVGPSMVYDHQQYPHHGMGIGGRALENGLSKGAYDDCASSSTSNNNNKSSMMKMDQVGDYSSRRSVNPALWSTKHFLP